MLPILQVPDPILRQVSRPVAKVDKQVLGFIRQLTDTLVKQTNPKGVGLSAIQVGKPWRIFTTLINGKAQTFINPEIISAGKRLTLNCLKKKPFLEGCLSIPRLYGPVFRHQWVKLKWQMANDKWQMDKFSGFEARVVQHEVDHLNGILFPDRSLADKLPLYEETKGS
jgi:peptide deformylase